MQKRLGLDLEIPDEFGWMIGGYVVAEACFAANIRQRNGCKNLDISFIIGIRADDLPGLEYIRDILGIGHVSPGHKKDPNRAPTMQYQVHAIGDLYHVIVPLFEKYPLPCQWRKSRDFAIWKQLVHIIYHEGGLRRKGRGRTPDGKGQGYAPLPQSYWDRVEPLVAELKQSRQFSKSMV